MPLLPGIHVRADGEGLALIAPNRSMMLRLCDRAAIERCGRIVGPARYWVEIVRHAAAAGGDSALYALTPIRTRYD